MHNGKPGESRKGSDNLIHKYIFRDKPVVIDVNSGAVHMVDPVIYDALDFYRNKICDKTAMEAALVPKYGAEALAEACSDIEELIAADMLFSDDEVSTEIFETKQPVVKAMCLHVAHDCNMNCAYCFGDKGAFEGVRCLLTPEMGKKALDFLMQNSGNRRNLEVDFFGGEPLMNWDVVKQLVETGDATHSIQGGKLLTGVSTLPDLDKDATDRNRTSPFAFTGNKFEFRMVGSADSIASPNTTLNAIVAEAFCEAADILEKADDFDIAVHDLIKKYLTEHQRIIFNGNGYSEEWVEEAARRGLPNIKSMVEASETLTTEKSIKLFEKFGIFTKAELESREEVLYETYSKTINIEALTMVDMAKKQYIPAVMEYTRTLADTVLAVKSAGADATVQTTVLKSISEKLAEAQAAETALEDKLAEAAGIEDPKKLAFFYKDVVHTAMDDLRTPVDELEMMVDKKVWPVPTYGDLIFEV